MSNVPATRPQQQQKTGLVIKSPEDLQRWMLSVVNDPKRGKALEGLIDRKSVFMAIAAIRQSWWSLSKCTPESIFESMMTAGAYGWTCDGITGQAYIVPFGNRATLMPGYKGLIDLVRRANQCEVSLETVHEGDEYEYLGRFKEPRHIRSRDANRRQKPVQHAYVLAAFTTGIVKCFSWSVEECIAHRDRYSQGFKRVAGDAQKRQDNPWWEGHPGFPAMCCKTVLRNAINRGEIPISLKDNRGEQRLAPVTLAYEDEPTDEQAFQSPAGFDETLHTEPQAAYAVEPAAAPASGDRFQLALAKIATAGTTDDAIAFGAEYDTLCAELPEAEREDAKNLGFEAVEKQCATLTAAMPKRGQRANQQRPLPVEA